jgi:hypothetical protein
VVEILLSVVLVEVEAEFRGVVKCVFMEVTISTLYCHQLANPWKACYTRRRFLKKKQKILLNLSIDFRKI